MSTISPSGPATAPAKGTGKFSALSRPRHLSRCGRAVLLGCVGFYLLAQLALDLVLDGWHPTLQDNCQTYKLQQVREIVAGAPERPLLVMLGSSRTQYALQAELLDGLPGPGDKPLLAYNLGVPMAGGIHACLYLREMLDAGVRPCLLLVEFSPVLLNEFQKGRLSSEEAWTVTPWMSLSQLVRCWPYFARPRAKAMEWLEARLAPWYVFRSHLLLEWWQEKVGRTVGLHSEHNHDRWGFLRRSIVNREQRAGYLAIVQDMSRETLDDFRVGTGPLRALRDLFDTARREGIPVAVVLMPESTTFRSWYPPGELAHALREFAALRDACGIDTIDAQRWLAADDFVDGHHPTEPGARIFTTRLIEELRPILARIGGATPHGEPAAVAAADRH
jgi:hypothetical protein